MHRPRVSSVLVAVALAVAAVIPILAAPAGAVVTTQCSAGQYPDRYAGQSALKVQCTTATADLTNRIEIHDADNAIWHHRAARLVVLGMSPFNTPATVALSGNSPTIHFAAGTISLSDIRRPVSVIIGGVHFLRGGTFIKNLMNSTTATLSQTACGGCTTTTAVTMRIEHTHNRMLADATCNAGTATVTTTSPGFSPYDLGKSVTGGPFAPGTYIDVEPAYGALTAHLNQTHVNGCSTNNGGDNTAFPPVSPIAGVDTIVIGAATFNTTTGLPVWNTLDPMIMELSNTLGGGVGFTCNGSATLAMTAAAKLDTGGFVSGANNLPVTIRKSVNGVVTTLVTTKIVGVSPIGNTSLTLAAPCPILAAVSATNSQHAYVGVPGANAPVNNDAVMPIGIVVNVNPALVKTQDDCNQHTLEGVALVGGWFNPSAAYLPDPLTPPVSVAQVQLNTSVVSFRGYVVPKRGGETSGPYSNPNPHFTFKFPQLPTAVSECIDKNGTLDPADDHPLDPSGIAIGVDATVMRKAPFLPIGSGNLGDPSVRSLQPHTTTGTVNIQQWASGSTLKSSDDSSCTVNDPFVEPAFTCGDG